MGVHGENTLHTCGITCGQVTTDFIFGDIGNNGIGIRAGVHPQREYRLLFGKYHLYHEGRFFLLHLLIPDLPSLLGNL